MDNVEKEGSNELERKPNYIGFIFSFLRNALGFFFSGEGTAAPAALAVMII